jgi:hypothetical protein
MSDDSVVKLIARGTLTDRLIEDGSRGWQPGISGRPGCRRKGRDRGLSLQPRDEGQSVAVHDWAGQIRLPLAGEQRRGCDTDYTVHNICARRLGDGGVLNDDDSANQTK